MTFIKYLMLQNKIHILNPKLPYAFLTKSQTSFQKIIICILRKQLKDVIKFFKCGPTPFFTTEMTFKILFTLDFLHKIN
jgi:hypothetical protein